MKIKVINIYSHNILFLFITPFSFTKAGTLVPDDPCETPTPEGKVNTPCGPKVYINLRTTYVVAVNSTEPHTISMMATDKSYFLKIA